MSTRWTKVPTGFTLPGITRGDGSFIRPGCSLSAYEEAGEESGWNGVCDEPATWTTKVRDDEAWDGERTIWSCDDHRADVLAQEAHPERSYGR